MKYLVTGANGFLGRATCEVLLRQGHEVTAMDNFSRFSGKKHLKIGNVEIIDGDIRDKNLLLKASREVEGIVHLAFINGTEYFYSKPNEVVDVGVRGMLNIADVALINNIEEIVLFSSSEVYQHPKTIPTPEEIELVIPDIYNPRYSYGGAKIASELILVNICGKFLRSWKILRPHNIYGPNMGVQHVIPALIEKVFAESKEIFIQGDGSQTRAFCHIEDFKNAFSLIIQHKAPAEIYNIGVDEEISILKLTKMILDIADSTKTIRTTNPNLGETRRRCPDISKISSLGFKQEITIQRGINELISTRRRNHTHIL
jgi:nucleoside-diphosphate-sugar epimerase